MKAGDYLFSGDYMESAGVPLQGGAGSFLVGEAHLLEQAPRLLMLTLFFCVTCRKETHLFLLDHTHTANEWRGGEGSGVGGNGAGGSGGVPLAPAPVESFEDGSQFAVSPGFPYEMWDGVRVPAQAPGDAPIAAEACLGGVSAAVATTAAAPGSVFHITPVAVAQVPSPALPEHLSTPSGPALVAAEDLPCGGSGTTAAAAATAAVGECAGESMAGATCDVLGRRRKRKNEPRQRMTSFEFRQRQKTFIADLETRVGELTTSNAEYQSRMHQLSSENQRMREELVVLRAAISRSICSLPPEVLQARTQCQPCRHPVRDTKT